MYTLNVTILLLFKRPLLFERSVSMCAVTPQYNDELRHIEYAVKKYSQMLFRICYNILGNKEDAEDAVQETVITAFKSIGNLRDDNLFKSWLFKILSNQCKSQLKKNKKNPDLLPEDDYIFLIEDESAPSSFNSIELIEALKSLTPPDAQIILLSIIGGFKSEELSKIYNLSPSTIRSKQRRALEKLRKVLG